MIEREKVIKGLTVCTKPGTRGCVYDIKECPYDNSGCRMALMRDALSLLKEQEPVVPLTIDDAVSELMDKHYKRLKRQETEGL